jgi:hypothetical protein
MAKFNILDHIDKLTHHKGDKYFCPVCGGNNLSIPENADTVGHKCFNGCEAKSIREAIGPWADRQNKTTQTQQTRQWVYADAAAKPSIRVNRTDDGQGSKTIWQDYQYNGIWTTKAPANTKAQAKATVMPYRYTEVMAAAAKGDLVYWVEGEQCADAMWALGLPATTSIGGSDGYKRYGDCSTVFAGVDLVICPDLDIAGIKYANAIAIDYSTAKWLYAFPDSAEWDDLPKSGGLDVVDWIASGADKGAIEAAVGARQVTGKVIAIATGNPIAPIDSLETEIAKLLDRNLTDAKLAAAKIKLRLGSSLTEREFAQLWDIVAGDYDREHGNSEEVRKLLRASQSRLALESVVSPAIALPLTEIAKMQNLRPEVYLIAMLTATGSLAQNGTTLLLHHGLGFEVTPNIFGAIVAEASQKKSPVINTVVTRPMKQLHREAKLDYQQRLDDWKKRQSEARANSEEFVEIEPSREIHYFTNTSGEAILAQAQRCPRRGLLNLSDELAGIFKSRNQYRSGRGSDAEDMLSFYDGSGGLSLRVDGVRNDVDSLNYGVLGSIQPRVLEKFLGDCEDSNGGWARFIFINQPIAASTLPVDCDTWDISELLTDYYRMIAGYEPTQYRLSRTAFEQFQRHYDELEQRRVTESNSALRAVIGKTAGRIGKVALNLHLIEAAIAGQNPSLEISAQTIERAALIAELAIEQIRAIYAECNPDDRQNPTMARIIELSRRRGAVSARDVSQALPTNRRASASEIRQTFIELVDQGFGEVTGEGRGLAFTAYPEQRPVVSTVEPEPIDPEPELRPGDQAVLVDHGYAAQGLAAGQQFTIVRIDLSTPTDDVPDPKPFATARDATGKQFSIWLAHLTVFNRNNQSRSQQNQEVV